MIDRLRNAIRWYLTNYGKKPTRVYLGRNEKKELLIWAQDNTHHSQPKLNKRMEFFGIKVYEVDSDNHITAC